MAATNGHSALMANSRSTNGSRQLYEHPRLSRRQTLPSVFPKDIGNLQGAVERMHDISRYMDQLESSYALTKKQITERKDALVESLESQFSALLRQLQYTYNAKKLNLQSLMRLEDHGENGDVQNSSIAGTLYTGHNGSMPDGFKQNEDRSLAQDELYRLCEFDLITECDLREMPDFFLPFRGLVGSSQQRLDMDRHIDVTGKGYARPASDFSSAWTTPVDDEHRAELSDSFTAFDFPKQNGVNGSFQSYSSGQFSHESYGSNTAFSPETAPLSPYPTSSKGFSYEGRPSYPRMQQESPPSCGTQDFFNSPPRALPNVPENTEHASKVNDLLRHPRIGEVLHTLADQFAPRMNSQNPYHGMGVTGLRRTNSHKSRTRSRRFSLPDASRISSWIPNAPGQYTSRTGSFIDGSSESFTDMLNDDAFLPGESGRLNSNMNELEILCRFGEIGIGPGQMNAPHGFCLGQNQEVIVADTNNHRIQFFNSNGNYKDQWGKPGKREGQLWYPRKVAWMPDSNRVVVCDRGHERSRVQIFSRHGVYERTIPMDYVAIVAGMTVYRNQIVIVDSVNPTCLILDAVGTVVFWFSCSKNMKEPSDVVVAHNMFYICDFKGHCICAYNGRGEFVSQIGENPTINFPNGIDVTEQGTILVGDSHGNRFHVAAYAPDGRFLAEYECPHMKVSRCCGLVLTSQGHIVTIAKNNNFVLILERLDNALDNRMAAPVSNSQVTEETEF